MSTPKESYSPGPEYTVLDKTGYTSTLYLNSTTNLALKSFFPSCSKRHFPNEVAAYTRLTQGASPPCSPHPNILTYHGTDTNDPEHPGILLERAENGNLYQYLWRYRHEDKNNLIWKKRFLKWAHQAASALSYAHTLGVMHSDIHCTNFLIASFPSLDLKVGDWAGASIDGSQSPSFYRTTHRLFEPGEDDRKGMDITVRSEIFAFGSALFNMLVGEDLWPELHYERDREEIVRRLREKNMPEMERLVCLRDVVRKCWSVEFKDMEEVVQAIEDEQQALEPE